jgi:hypothetical protein
MAPIDKGTKEEIKVVNIVVNSVSDSFFVISYATIIFSKYFFFTANSVELIDIIKSYRYLNIRQP